MRKTPLFWRISSARLAHLSHAACSVGVLPLLLPPASSMSSGFILLVGSLLLTKAQFSLAALPSEVSLPLHIVKADVVPARLLASAGNRGAARLQRGAALLVHNKLFFSPKFNNSNKKSPLVPL